VRRVAELGSLIWLNTVKRAVLLRSGKFLFLPASRHRGFSESGAGTLFFLRLFNAEMRESTRANRSARSYQQVMIRRGV